MSLTDRTGRRDWLARMLMLLPLAFVSPRLALGGMLQRDRKLPLEDAPFNTRFRTMRDPAQFATEMRAAQRNLLAYLEQHFELTDAQRGAIAAFPKKSIEGLNAALDRAVRENLALTIRGSKTGRCSDLRTRIDGDTLVVEIIS
jgi:hypothetical protein